VNALHSAFRPTGMRTSRIGQADLGLMKQAALTGPARDIVRVRHAAGGRDDPAGAVSDFGAVVRAV